MEIEMNLLTFIFTEMIIIFITVLFALYVFAYVCLPYIEKIIKTEKGCNYDRNDCSNN